MKTLKNGKYVETNENVEEKIPIEIQIIGLKQNLADTDYKAIKYAEGLLTAEQYAETKVLRQKWRDEINQLESEVVTDV